MEVSPIQVSFPAQSKQKFIMGDPQSPREDCITPVRRPLPDQKLLDRLSDPNYKIAPRSLLRRSARLQAKYEVGG
ncbi:unnamed protein product [Cuscuta epithymum]|uniref:Uncharacterized protein n=1 Tax=Cuscuta epithymum TaxID=186058 RepID=A0AAV0BXI0_9ASTE|nr:unnamed protein product [Cuscuta epithymum]